MKRNPIGKLMALEIAPALVGMWEKHPAGLTIKMIAREFDCSYHEAYAAVPWLVEMGKGRWVRRPDRRPEYLVPINWQGPEAWDLTRKQRDVLNFLMTRADKDRYAIASMRDICRGAMANKGGIVAILDALDRKDYLRFIDRGDSHRKTTFRVFPKGDAIGSSVWPQINREKHAQPVEVAR